MRFGINLPPFGPFADPATLAEMAAEAEQAGWDGLFLWDHMMFDPTFHPIADPWVALAAVASRTSRMRIGTLITPVARRRPWKLARESASLDRWSNGRLTLGVGLGAPAKWDFGFFDEPTDDKLRAQKLDEGLEILTGLWTGKPFAFEGRHYRLKEVTFRPVPVQSPRIPIWCAAWWPRLMPLRRAARWDGVCPGKDGMMLSPDEWRTILAEIRRHRTSDAPFDAVHTGQLPPEDPARAAQIIRPYAEVGVNWWLEPIDPWVLGYSWEEPWPDQATGRLRERVRQGPPR